MDEPSTSTVSILLLLNYIKYLSTTQKHIKLIAFVKIIYFSGLSTAWIWKHPPEINLNRRGRSYIWMERMCSSCVWNGKMHEKSIYPAFHWWSQKYQLSKDWMEFIFHMFKWQCLWICNLHYSHSLQRQVIHPYLEKGVYKGFTKKFLPVLLQKSKYKEEDVFLWNAYSDQDMKHESSLNKYPDRSTKGFYKLMYHNKTSVGNLLGQVKHQLDQLYCVLYTQKKNTRPNIATDK